MATDEIRIPMPRPRKRVDVSRCARCGRDHRGLEFQRLTNPTDEREWFARCPATREPILMEIRETERTRATEIARMVDSALRGVSLHADEAHAIQKAVYGVIFMNVMEKTMFARDESRDRCRVVGPLIVAEVGHDIAAGMSLVYGLDGRLITPVLGSVTGHGFVASAATSLKTGDRVEIRDGLAWRIGDGD